MTDEHAPLPNNLVVSSKDAFFEALAETAKEVPLAGAVMAVLGGISQGRKILKFQKYLEEISRRLAFGNIEGVVGFIASHIEEPWMVEGLEQGWKDAQETFDPLARLCVYAMVADYLVQNKAPDPLHRRLGLLFQEADAALLRMISKISQAKQILGCRYIAVTESVRHVDVDGGRFYEVQDGHNFYQLLEELKEPELLRGACALLIRVGLMSPWFSPMEMPHARSKEMGVYSVFGAVQHHQSDAWKSLHKYLAPVRTETGLA
ncbi:hypothetical protein [Nannocystis radixulma]|uniref:Uncharacterized protein n=1 Tax=Nannocystis radixulma TaxID=2995305 RepID=A0ABT5BPK1_9BACT|nr:hypothetical protein [Nannocystis radixulma]MDC0676095.1 hypothetical protein [Nannocystis radixulma]